jgi:hypothetical protein
MEELFALLDEIGYPYFRQGSMSDKDYKPEFFTYWNIDTTNDSFYDNNETRYIEYIQVGLYTNNARSVYTLMDDFIERAKNRGFVIVGRPQDANADKTEYFGRVCYLRKINKIQGE